MSRRGSVGIADTRRKPADPEYPRPSAFPIHELGEGRLVRGLPDGRPQKVLRIDVTGAPPNLLDRLLVGSYITGQDQVLVTARHGLTLAQRKEVHRAVDRILGMTVVADTPTTVEVQNFIDPGKYELPRLLHRVVQMLRAELQVCLAALQAGESLKLQVVDSIEEEIDRFYLLMVRQLLLSSESAQIARNIDVESRHYQIGDRLVAKTLELIGDLIHGIGVELRSNLRGLGRVRGPVIRELSSRVARLERLLTRTMDAFGHLSVVQANETLNAISEVLPTDARLGQEICRRILDRKVAVSAQRIVFNLDMALELLVVINEVTINRCVEPETEVHPQSTGPVPARGTVRPLEESRTAIAILAPDTSDSAVSET